MSFLQQRTFSGHSAAIGRTGTIARSDHLKHHRPLPALPAFSDRQHPNITVIRQVGNSRHGFRAECPLQGSRGLVRGLWRGKNWVCEMKDPGQCYLAGVRGQTACADESILQHGVVFW